jgi:hypothetical protein
VVRWLPNEADFSLRICAELEVDGISGADGALEQPVSNCLDREHGGSWPRPTSPTPAAPTAQHSSIESW